MNLLLYQTELSRDIWWVVMVTLHEATSSLNNANGFTVRRDGHHPKIMVSVPELESGTHAPKARVSPSTPHRENLQRAGSRIRPGDTYLEGRYVSSYTIPALCRLKLFMELRVRVALTSPGYKSGASLTMLT